MNIVVTPLAVFVISILLRSQPGLSPELSCSTHTRSRSPMSSSSRINRFVWPRSNRFRNFWQSCLRPESPLEPKMVMKTLASVPAPFSSPVITMASYFTGTRLWALLVKLSMNLLHSNVWNSSRFEERGMAASHRKIYLSENGQDRDGKEHAFTSQ